MKEGRSNPKLAKALAVALGAVSAAGCDVPQGGVATPPAQVAEAPGKGAAESYTELLLLKLDTEHGWDRFDAETKVKAQLTKILKGVAKEGRLELARRVAEEFPKNKIGELAAERLLQEYSTWKVSGQDWGVVEKLAERAPFYFLLIANDVAEMPSAPALVRKTLSRWAVAISYFDKYNKVPGAVDILIENTRKQALTDYSEADALLASNILSDAEKQKIREALPSRSRQLFLTLLSLQNTRAVAVKETLVDNPAFNQIDDNVLATVAKHLKKDAVPFGDAELEEWRKEIIPGYYSVKDGLEKKSREAKVAMFREVYEKYGVHPLQLMYRSAHGAQYLFNRGQKFSDETAAKALAVIEARRAENANKPIPKHAVVLTHNEKYKGVSAMAQPAKLKAIEDRVKGEGGTYTHIHGDEPDVVELATKAIINAPAGMVLYAFAHGSPDGIFLRDGGQDLGGGSVATTQKSRYISPAALAEALAVRYRDKSKKPEDDVILSHACYQSDYVEGFAIEAAKRGVYIPLFAAPSEQGTTATGHASTPLGTKIEESWIKAKTRGDLFKQEFKPDTASHPSIFVPDKTMPFTGARKHPVRGHTPAMMQISGISTYQGVAIG
ncbi:MAG: hypothetical protein AAB421_02940 [Patescibacteria group bacterium]|mgnify:CR=1 FL=1